MTAVQNKERSAERELVEALEQIADELYPEDSDGADNNEGEEGEDMEAMLKRELSGMSGDQRSKRFRLCRHETPCRKLTLSDHETVSADGRPVQSSISLFYHR